MYSVQWLAKTFVHSFPDILRVLYETLKNLITTIMATIHIQLLPNYRNYIIGQILNGSENVSYIDIFVRF